MATPGRPRRPPQSANTLLCGLRTFHLFFHRASCPVLRPRGEKRKCTVRSAQTKVWPVFVRGAGPVSRSREETPSPP